MFALTFSDCFVHFFKSGALRGVSAKNGISFVSFSLGLFLQRKAAKDFCYQRSSNAFSFETIAPKEKALQKENGRIRLRGERCCAQGATFKKVDKTIAKSKCEHPDKSKFVPLLWCVLQHFIKSFNGFLGVFV